MTDFPDWQQPQAAANSIAATGVPLLTKSDRLFQQFMTPIGGGQTVNTGPLTVTQIGYEIDIGIQVTAGATVPFAEIQLQWVDGGTGTIVATDSFIVPAATNLGGFEVFGHGPTKADQLTMYVTNLDASHVMSAAPIILQNSRVYTSDVWRFANSISRSMTVPGWTLPTLPDDESVLGIVTGGAVPASGSASWLFGIGYGGWLQLAGNTAGPAASNLTVTVFALPSSVYGGGGIIQRVGLTTAAFSMSVHAPRSPLQVQVSNVATTAGTVSMMATVSP